MKILHMCLACFYIDNYSYQENLLPKYHKKMGYDVEIVASLVSFNSSGQQILLDKGSTYINADGIQVTRLEYKNVLIDKILRRYKNTFEFLEKSNPNIIFIHGVQFSDIKIVKNFVKNKEISVFIDNHSDFSNSAKGFFSKYILHRVIWRYYANMSLSFTKKYYGVLPARVDFLHTEYKIPKKKIELLIMGADDDDVRNSNNLETIEKVKSNAKITSDEFLIVTGGKIDPEKRQILTLMSVVNQLATFIKVKLLIFGSIHPKISEEFYQRLNDKIVYVGWADVKQSYDFFAAADLVVFPGRHSVYWEQVVALNKPLVVKMWNGTNHVDIGGNCDFLFTDKYEELHEKLLKILSDKDYYMEMLKSAQSIKSEDFLYSTISKKSLID